MGYRSQAYIKLTNERMPQLYSILSTQTIRRLYYDT